LLQQHFLCSAFNWNRPEGGHEVRPLWPYSPYGGVLAKYDLQVKLFLAAMVDWSDHLVNSLPRFDSYR